MLSREEIEQREIDYLAPYAVKSRFSQGRVFPETEHPYRSVFQRDKDRIIFSAAFRRLQYKTQVFSNFEGDHYRTRLTHTLEVSQISRSIARSLRLNEDLSEAIALAHDLGHGPFGHIGEKILNACMRDHGGFEHNRQSVRVVEELEDIYAPGKGLNLTAETREGLQKHTYHDAATLPVSFSTLEAQIVDSADEIAYDSHDLDDGLRSELFSLSDALALPLCARIALKISERHPNINTYQRTHLLIRYLIDEQVTDLLTESERRIGEEAIRSAEDIKKCRIRLVDFSDSMHDEKEELKEFLATNFYGNKRVMKIVALAEEYIKGLFEFFTQHTEKMPQHFAKKARAAGANHYRIICDYIAGMTDRYAVDVYKRLVRGKK